MKENKIIWGCWNLIHRMLMAWKTSEIKIINNIKDLESKNFAKTVLLKILYQENQCYGIFIQA